MPLCADQGAGQRLVTRRMWSAAARVAPSRVARRQKTLERLLHGQADAHIEFAELTVQSGPGAVTVSQKYELIVFWSAEDAAFVVDVPESPGCMAHGATPPDAVTAAQKAIELWLEAAAAAGRPIPEPKGRRLLYA